MTRPITIVYQELAAATPTAVEPDLNTIVIAPAYQILDYEDDKVNIQVADYGALNGDNPLVPPVGGSPAVVVAAPPGIVPGGWVDPDSIRVYFDDLRVIMTDGADGAVTSANNLLTSAGATFITDGVAAGDILIIDNPAGPATPNLVLTVRTVVSETTLTVSTNFLATLGTLNYRIERQLDDREIDSSFVVEPTYRVSNEITLLGGVTVAVGVTQRVVSYAKVYVAYRAYRTDLQAKLSIDPGTAVADIETKVGKIDARNPLAALLFTASQNAGQAPIYGFGVESDDLVGYTAARDLLSSDKAIYAVVVGTPLLSIIAMFNADNVTLADPNLALASGVPQKFRVVIGSVPLVTVEDVVEETLSGTTEALAGAIPAGNRTVTFVNETLMTAGVRPGDVLVLTATAGGSANGSYAIAHINSQTALETDTAVPAFSAGSANVRIYRPSTGLDIIPLADYRGSLTRSGVVIRAAVAGTGAGADAITVALVESATPPGAIQSIVEVAGTSTIINGNWAAGTLTALDVVNALNTGAGVDVPFTGSVNVVASTTSPATIVAAAGSAAISTGTPGVNDVTTSALNTVFIRLFDASAAFISDGVVPGDIIEIPASPGGAFTGSGTKQFVVNTVISEQRLEIQNIVAGSYVNNSSTVEAELPHGDDRTGTGTLVGTVRYRVRRELTKDQQADRLVSIGQSLRSQRAIICWSDSVAVSGLTDGSKPRLAGNQADDADPQSGAFLAAVVGGMTAGLPNHQGFSRLGCAGIDRVFHSQVYFTEAQLTRISEGGIYVFVQETPESLPYSIHQLTTDTSALQTGEYSMVKNFDYLSKFFVGILDAYPGVWNVTEELLGFMRQSVNSGVQLLKSKRVARIGAPLNDAAIVSLAVSTISPDRVELYLNVGRPAPLNVIGLHLIG